MGRPQRHGWWLVAALLGLQGCSGCGADESQPAPAPSGAPAEGDGIQPMLSLFDTVVDCDVEHSGLLLDLGERPGGGDAMLGRYAGRLEAPTGITAARHAGASWAQIYDRRVTLELMLHREAPIFVALRAIGRDARRVVVSLDGVYLGSLALAHEKPAVVRTAVTAKAAEPGLHLLGLRFDGRKRSGVDPFAEVDWVRVGVDPTADKTYWAPTFDAAVVSNAQIGGVPHRALALRSPGAFRCPLRVPAQATLRLAVGFQGRGQASARVLVRQDGAPPTQLEQVQLDGGEDGAWKDLDLPLHHFAGRVVMLELAVLDSSGSGRLLFGDPAVYVPARPPAPKMRSRVAVVVVFDGVDKRELPPWRTTPTPHLPVLTQLVREGAVFDQHRAPATLVSAAVASLLTGRSPVEHMLTDAGARLPHTVPTLATFARDGSVPAAMFTGVPATFAPFGFSVRWDRFEQYPPNGGRLATAPLDDAAAWLRSTSTAPDGGRPLLAVIHARGGHPPWDVTPEEAKKLPPTDYTGYLDPRRAAQMLAHQRGHQSRLGEADRERMRALYLTALSGQDAALGKLIGVLRDAGRWDETLLVVTGDVSSARDTLFTDSLPLTERALELPLYVHFPGGLHAGERIAQPTESYDVTASVIAALGLEPPPGLLGRDLAELTMAAPLRVEPLRIAYSADGYAARLGEWLLIGKHDQRPRLCALSLDPTCAYDHSDSYPMVRQAMWRWLVAFSRGRPAAAVREPLTLDSEAAAWLSAWGAD